MHSGPLAAMLRLPAQRREERQALVRAVQALDFVGLGQQTELLARNLSYGNQRLLEVARAIATRTASADPR